MKIPFFKKKDRKLKKEIQKTEPQLKDVPKRQIIEITEKDSAISHYMGFILAKNERDRVIKILKMSVLFNVFLSLVAASMFYWGIVYKRDIYFATTPDGRLQEMVALSEPYISDAGLSNWAAQVITETFTMDFRNYKKKLASMRPYYSDEAWKKLLVEIEPLVNTIVKERVMLFTVIDEAPRVLARGEYRKGVYSWKLEFPITLTNQMTDHTRTMKWNVQTLISRAQIAEKSDGVEIIQVVIRQKG